MKKKLLIELKNFFDKNDNIKKLTKKLYFSLNLNLLPVMYNLATVYIFI